MRPAGLAAPFNVICQGGVCRLDRRHTEPVGTQAQPTALINNPRLSCYNSSVTVCRDLLLNNGSGYGTGIIDAIGVESRPDY